MSYSHMPIHMQYNFQLHYNIYIFLYYFYYIQNKFGKIASWTHISLIFLSMFVLHMHCTLIAATMNQFFTRDLARSLTSRPLYNGVSQALYRLHYMQIPWASIPWATKTMCPKPCLNLKWVLFIWLFYQVKFNPTFPPLNFTWGKWGN